MNNLIIQYGNSPPHYQASPSYNEVNRVSDEQALINIASPNGVFWVIDGRNESKIGFLISGFVRREKCNLYQEIVNICCNYYGNEVQGRLKKHGGLIADAMRNEGKGFGRFKAWCILVNDYGYEDENVLSIDDVKRYLELDMQRVVNVFRINAANGDGFKDTFEWMKQKTFKLSYGR